MSGSIKLSTVELHTLIDGEDPIDAKKQAALRARISKEAEQYIDSPVILWPDIIFNWDVSLESQRFSLDGVTQGDFKEYYPDGFIFGYVSLSEFDKILCHYSRIDDGELWELGSKYSLANLIVYLSEGRAISPPLVKSVDNGEVIFQGGHHRYAIAKVTGVDVFPIHVQRCNKAEIDKRVNVDWVNL
ncbi:transcriptional regulator [Colwellia ponticola]|uniref:Transcriptional regulator n=1 Tax=Colwellia ponticola TaxID=2304625 RepID=A0A8H2PMV4_9GAMM|nr:transcriptional regulator [Colwellia ponticola]TMM47059.1 transcriptional regulator [Colwellia ponticola]